MDQARSIKVLIVEDCTYDAELIKREIARYGFEPKCRRVETAWDLMDALKSEDWDMVTCDYSMPEFNGQEALEIVKEFDPALPLIIVSGEIDISVAVSLMKQGAWDYVSKNELARLPVAVYRELLNARLKRERKLLESAKRDGDELLCGLMANVPNYVAMLDYEGRIRFINKLDEHEGQRLLGHLIYEFIPADYSQTVREIMQQVFSEGKQMQMEFPFVMKECTHWWEATFGPMFDEGFVYGVIACAMDVSYRKKAEKAINEDRNRLLGILESMPDGVYIVNQAHDIQYINPAIANDFGEISGQKCYQYFHDRTSPCPWCKNSQVFQGESVQWEWTSLKNGKTYELLDTPLLNPDGSISKLEFFHDITGHVKNSQEWSRHYANLFETVPSAVLVVEQASGSIIDANQSACRLYGYTHQELINLKLYALLANRKHAFDPLHPLEQLHNHDYHCRKDGQTFVAEISRSSSVLNGREVYICSVNERR